MTGACRLQTIKVYSQESYQAYKNFEIPEMHKHHVWRFKIRAPY